LIEIVVAGVNSFPENIVLFASKELKEGEKYGILPIEDSGGSQVKGVDVKSPRTN
jgi:hypothetical protein